jgi:sulfoxide reductase heme-binding subunit YedZ
LRSLKPLVFALALAPAAWLTYGIFTGGLGPNPAETLQLETGIWTFRFLLTTLAITPARRLTGWNVLVRYRRMLGLFAFFYASVHLLTYVVLDHFFAWDAIAQDIVKRPFITAGMAAFALMVPLAITSTKGWIRRLGRRWQQLHRLVYLSGIAAAVHFIWKVKVAIGEPVYYAVILAVLLAFRLAWRFRPAPPLRPSEAAPRTIEAPPR